MKQANLFGTLLVLAGLTIAVLIGRDEQPPEIQKPCQQVKRVPVTATFHFDYCPETDKVRYDTTWIEPGMFERHRIKERGL